MKTTAELVDLSGKVALVTGGSAGIGQAVCRRLWQAGAAVAVCGSTEANARKTTDTLVDGPNVLPLGGDLKDESQVAALVEQTQRELGQVDILVNNAATFPCRDIDAEDMPAWNEVMSTNIGAAYQLARGVAGPMRQRGGVIINFSSVVIWGGKSNSPAYTASKAAAVGLTRHLARELGPFRIRVNCVAPA